MKICDMQTGRMRITRALKSLREEWLATLEHWNDANRVAFEQQYLQPLAPQVTLLLAATQELAEVLERIEKDCRDEDDRWDL